MFFAASMSLRAGEIGDVGRRLAGEQRIVDQPLLLRPLDLGVPIGALDEPRRDPPAGLRAERVRPRRSVGRARLP